MPDLTDIVTLLYRIRRLGRPKDLIHMQGRDMVPGQRVQIEGAGEVCVVLRIDHRRHLADLLRLGAVRKVETGIPLALLTAAEDSSEIDDDMKISA